MRMPKNEFLRHALSHIVDREITFFAADRRVKYHLKKDIPKLIAKIIGVTRLSRFLDRVIGLVSLLEQVLRE